MTGWNGHVDANESELKKTIQCKLKVGQVWGMTPRL